MRFKTNIVPTESSREVQLYLPNEVDPFRVLEIGDSSPVHKVKEALKQRCSQACAGYIACGASVAWHRGSQDPTREIELTCPENICPLSPGFLVIYPKLDC